MLLSALRKRGVALLIAATLASVPLGLGSAAAAAPQPGPTVTVKGSAHQVTATSPDILLDYSIDVDGAALADPTLVVTLPAGAQVVPGSAKFDSAALPADRVDAVAGGAKIRLGAPAAGGRTVAAGAHDIQFLLDPRTARKRSDVTATLTYAVDQVPGTAKANALALPLPDVVVKVPDYSGEDETLPLQTGEIGDFVVEISNAGAPTDAATLSIALPTGLTIDEDFGVQRGSDDGDDDDSDALACRTTSAHLVTCALGKLGASTQFVDIPVRATRTAPVGKVGRFTVSAEADSGLDANPADNSVTGSVLFVGGPHLKVTITPPKKTVVVGHSAKLRIAVKNTGNLPAADVFGLIAVVDRIESPRHKHFEITGFSGHVFDLDGGDLLTAGESGSGITTPSDSSRTVQVVTVSGSPQRTLAKRNDAAAGSLPVIAWNVGTIAAGHTSSAVLTVRATAVGPGVVAAAAFSIDIDLDDCTGPDLTDCDEFALATLTAVAPVPTPANATTNPLADTGAPTGQLTAFGLLALFVGLLLLWAGRRRDSCA